MQGQLAITASSVSEPGLKDGEKCHFFACAHGFVKTDCAAEGIKHHEYMICEGTRIIALRCKSRFM